MSLLETNQLYNFSYSSKTRKFLYFTTKKNKRKTETYPLFGRRFLRVIKSFSRFKNFEGMFGKGCGIFKYFNPPNWWVKKVFSLKPPNTFKKPSLLPKQWKISKF